MIKVLLDIGLETFGLKTLKSGKISTSFRTQWKNIGTNTNGG